MRATTGFLGDLSVNDGTSNAMVPLDGTAKVSIPGGKVKMHDYLPLSNEDRVLRKIPGNFDSGDVKFSIYYNANDCDRLENLHGQEFLPDSPTIPVMWEVRTMDDPRRTYSFEGTLAEFEPGELDSDSITMMTGTIAISGPVTIDTEEE